MFITQSLLQFTSEAEPSQSCLPFTIANKKPVFRWWDGDAINNLANLPDDYLHSFLLLIQHNPISFKRTVWGKWISLKGREENYDNKEIFVMMLVSKYSDQNYYISSLWRILSPSKQSSLLSMLKIALWKLPTHFMFKMFFN